MKLFIITSRVPYPLDKGDKLRAYNQLKELSKNNEIFLFALNDTPLHPEALCELKKYCSEIHIETISKINVAINLFRSLFTSLPMQVGYFYSTKTANKVLKKINAFKPEHIYCQLIRTSEYVKKIKHIPKTLDYMDSFSKGVERRMQKQVFYLKPLFNAEYKRVSKYESAVFNYFENKIIISEQDKNEIKHPDKNKILVIPNGVDTDFFKPVAREKKYSLIFNGNMSYPPNIESAIFLAKKVMPIVRKDIPDANLLLSGTNPSAEVIKLQNKFITVSGWVKDVRENYAMAKVSIAPMLISIGMQNKLLEAMAMQLPCITSTLANNALGAENKKEILIADSPEEYAQQIVFLLKEEYKATEIAHNGFRFVSQKYTWSKTVEILQKLFKGEL